MRLYMEFEPSGTDEVFNLETSFPHEITKEQATSMFRAMLDTATAFVQTLGLNTSETVKEAPKKEEKTMRSGYVRKEPIEKETSND